MKGIDKPVGLILLIIVVITMGVISSLVQGPQEAEETSVTEEITPNPVFNLGPLVVTSTVINTWIMIAFIGVVSFFIGRSFHVRPGPVQNAIEIFLRAIDGLIRQNVGADDTSIFLPLIATLAVFVGGSNLLGLIPGLHSPVPDINTPVAMALIVFVSVPYFGVRTQGLWGYLKHYVQPIFLMLPIEIASEIARTFSLTFRLFGNILGEEIIIAILFMIAPFVVPVPMMLFSIFTGLLQAYIFTLLACVYIGGAVKAHR